MNRMPYLLLALKNQSHIKTAALFVSCLTFGVQFISANPFFYRIKLDERMNSSRLISPRA